MPAELIWDNANPSVLRVPERMGTPAAHQLRGSTMDNLAELAGRVCYDSLGSEKSRSSAEYHAHIREVQHLSVYRHCAFTVRLHRHAVLSLLNRPGVFVSQDDDMTIRVALNLQHVIEWARVGPALTHGTSAIATEATGKLLTSASAYLAPLACGRLALDRQAWLWQHLESAGIQIVTPEIPEERWLSFYIHGVSRGLTHELVRHGAYTAVSQRSTRYCDESESDYIWHPAIDGAEGDLSFETRDLLLQAKEVSQRAYRATVYDLTHAGVDRKQARGAARGVLGNALETECIFSASLARWREIGALRNHPLADGEIRELFSQIAEVLPT